MRVHLAELWKFISQISFVYNELRQHWNNVFSLLRRYSVKQSVRSELFSIH